MDKRVLRERMRKKQQQIRRRQMMKKGAYVVAVILVFIFVIRGIILPVINRVGGKNTDKPAQVQAETDTNANINTGDSGTETQIEKDTNAAIRKPLKGASDLTKASQLTAGWHEDENGKWYQNVDGTYYAGGLQEIDGSTYYFGDNGYAQTGWVSVGFDDYYFNDDGTYDPSQHKTRIAFTFDDGPGEYTDQLLDCLEQNNAHATFFMLGQNVENWQSEVQRMVDIGCEIGSHSWDHLNLYDLDMDAVAKEFSDTDAALEKACGQKASVARAPYGNWSDDIISTVGKPFFIIKEGMKSKDELAKWGDEVVVFESGNPPKDYVALIEKGYERALEAVSSGDYDLVVLDEYNMALFFELIDWKKTEALLEARNPETEVVFTGRGAPQELLDVADLVTEMKEVKHYYMQGVMARKGIEN